jgi:hypothetical protein
MKRMTYLFVVLFAALAVYSGCKKDEGSSSTPVKIDSAKVSGKALVDLNQTNDTAGLGKNGIIYENVPAGTIIHVQYNSKDLVTVPDNAITYGDVYFNTVVSAAGTYSFSVPVNLKTVAVSITSDDFEYLQVQADTTTKRTIFTLAEVNVNVNRGQKQIQDLTFGVK